jgi:hypothetical protein
MKSVATEDTECMEGENMESGGIKMIFSVASVVRL